MFRAPDRMWKKIKNYVEIFGNMMQKNVLIMQQMLDNLEIWIISKATLTPLAFLLLSDVQDVK